LIAPLLWEAMTTATALSAAARFDMTSPMLSLSVKKRTISICVVHGPQNWEQGSQVK
jgi:hypothetical protein